MRFIFIPNRPETTIMRTQFKLSAHAHAHASNDKWEDALRRHVTLDVFVVNFGVFLFATLNWHFDAACG